MEPWPVPELIRTFYRDVTFWAHSRYQYNYHNSYVDGCYWTAHNALRTVMIYAGVYEYYQHGNGD
jgi:hypothetical protein